MLELWEIFSAQILTILVFLIKMAKVVKFKVILHQTQASTTSQTQMHCLLKSIQVTVLKKLSNILKSKKIQTKSKISNWSMKIHKNLNLWFAWVRPICSIYPSKNWVLEMNSNKMRTITRQATSFLRIMRRKMCFGGASPESQTRPIWCPWLIRWERSGRLKYRPNSPKKPTWKNSQEMTSVLKVLYHVRGYHLHLLLLIRDKSRFRKVTNLRTVMEPSMRKFRRMRT